VEPRNALGGREERLGGDGTGDHDPEREAAMRPLARRRRVPACAVVCQRARRRRRRWSPWRRRWEGAATPWEEMGEGGDG
jgi:hypothetical protein